MKIQFLKTSYSCALVAILCAVSAANAQTSGIPTPATYAVSAEGGTAISVAGSVSGASCGTVGCQTDSASAGGTSAMAQGISTCDLAGCARSIAGGTEDYSFVVNGPPNVSVMMDIVGSVSTSAGGDPASLDPASAEATLNYDGVVLSGCSSAEAGGCGTVPSSAGVNTSFLVTTGAVTGVSLSAGISAFGGTAQATADPTITIDPSSLAEYPTLSLVFSSNLTPVPLPAAAWLLLSGLGGLGLIVRRRAS